jgi:hypothetical protein
VLGGLAQQLGRLPLGVADAGKAVDSGDLTAGRVDSVGSLELAGELLGQQVRASVTKRASRLRVFWSKAMMFSSPAQS